MDPRNLNMNINVGQQMTNMNMNSVPDEAMNLLAQSTGCFVKQRMELLEILTGCETKNRYDVALKINNTFYMAFHCKEVSNCCCRNFCPSELREFQMDIKYFPNGVDRGSWALIDRPFKCSCYCLCRPEMTIKLRSGEYIGKVAEPWGCCQVCIDIANSQNQVKYQIDRTYCESAFLCRNNWCGAMSGVDFPILYNDGGITGNGKLQDGNIERKGRSLLETFVDSDADCFDVNFPKTASPQEKLLIIATVLMLDFRYFEDNGDDDKKRGGGVRMGMNF